MTSSPSIVQDLGESVSECGYCKNKLAEGGVDSFCSHGLWAHRLSAADYQGLIDIGWRRSGSYLYRPLHSCCSLHTIRLDVTKFQKTSSQKNIEKRMERFCKGTWSPGGSSAAASGDAAESVSVSETSEKSTLFFSLETIVKNAFATVLGSDTIGVKLQHAKKKELGDYCCSSAIGIAQKMLKQSGQKSDAMDIASRVAENLYLVSPHYISKISAGILACWVH